MMDNDNSLNKRPTFKRALRNISITSIFITMMLIWLLLSVTSVLTLKQYAQKNLALTAATMTYSLEAAVVFADGPAATETLAALGQQGLNKLTYRIERFRLTIGPFPESIMKAILIIISNSDIVLCKKHSGVACKYAIFSYWGNICPADSGIIEPV